jgi:CheY-like chemotaxis protein/HPt (histidine-containing phosphotransfer) domain-containing protein
MKEYESDPDYIESLTDKLIVFLTADKGYQLPKDSNIRFFEKPLYCFPIINALNSGITDIEKNVQMTCPGLKALIVDDEPMNLKVANDIFGKYQMTATTASSGSKAIEMCKEEHFDIIFMDYMMPEIDGIETARRIRANIAQGQPIPLFVAVTANDVSSVRELFNKEGFDGFVGKPVNKIEIESVLKNILSPSQIKYVSADKIKRTTVATKPRPKKAGNASFESTLKKLGVIIDSGLKYCQNDMDMYKEIVMDLASRAKDYVVEADILFNDNKPEEYAIKLHAIKGLFKMIGANDMSEKAYTLEKAGKGGNIDDVKELHTEVMNWYLSFADKVN